MSEVFVHKDEQETTKKAPYLRGYDKDDDSLVDFLFESAFCCLLFRSKVAAASNDVAAARIMMGVGEVFDESIIVD